jgi:predicted acetyltransferase
MHTPHADDFGPPRSEAEVGAYARMVSLSFASDPARAVEWAHRSGPTNIRLLHEGGRPVAGLLRLPMGQHWGGRSVPMVGIAGVAVPPENRGRGYARRLMALAVRELADEGVALSTLYASTQPLYRSVGYEQAGAYCRVKMPPPRATPDHRWALCPLTEADEPEARGVYARFARGFDGTLNRGDYVWRRTLEFRERTYIGLGVREPGPAGATGPLRGYMRYSQTRGDRLADVLISDLAFDHPDAGRRLLGAMADFGTVVDSITFAAGATHPILTLNGSLWFDMELGDYWLMRVCDARAALEARGWPAGVKARLRLEVTDALVPANAGVWTLSVEGGRATLERDDAPGLPTLRANERGLASLYAGYLGAHGLALAGLIEGDAEAMALADSIFVRATPWMLDAF